MKDIEIKEGEEYVVQEDPGVKEDHDVQLEVMRPPLDGSVFDGFDGFDLPDVDENAYDEICEQIDMKYGSDDSESRIDKLYKKLQKQNNRLQEIKQRKASKYDQSTIENELRRAAMVQQYLDEIEQMTEAWIANPKLKSDAQKKAFLSDYVHKSKTIGIENTVEVMLPCLINAFNSDKAVHPDLYEHYSTLLFSHLGELIKFLGKNS